MSNLKAVILSVSDVIVEKGELVEETFAEVVKLIKFLQLKGLTPIVLARKKWVSIDDKTNEKHSLQDELFKHVKSFPWYCSDENNDIPTKDGSSKPVEYILNKHQLKPNEVIYIGNSLTDMRTAVNSKVLFLNAKWYDSNTTYGFIFNSPRAIAKFIDIFCLRNHWWGFSIEKNGLRAYALSIFSTYIEKYAMTSSDAKSAAKEGRGKLEFWAHYTISSIYFSGLYNEIDYIAPYPRHKAGTGNATIADVLDVFAKCFRIKYIPDLIMRHKDAEKSQTLRQAKRQPSHLNQINSIHLNKKPLKNSKGETYAKTPLAPDKTVLVIDDILTEGYSLDAARIYIESTGAKVILLAWLKTINTHYHKGVKLAINDPYREHNFTTCDTDKIYSYGGYILNNKAQDELDEKFKNYDNWSWPKELA